MSSTQLVPQEQPTHRRTAVDSHLKLSAKAIEAYRLLVEYIAKKGGAVEYGGAMVTLESLRPYVEAIKHVMTAGGKGRSKEPKDPSIKKKNNFNTPRLFTAYMVNFLRAVHKSGVLGEFNFAFDAAPGVPSIFDFVLRDPQQREFLVMFSSVHVTIFTMIIQKVKKEVEAGKDGGKFRYFSLADSPLFSEVYRAAMEASFANALAKEDGKKKVITLDHLTHLDVYATQWTEVVHVKNEAEATELITMYSQHHNDYKEQLAALDDHWRAIKEVMSGKLTDAKYLESEKLREIYQRAYQKPWAPKSA
jgi:hypothetical protein